MRSVSSWLSPDAGGIRRRRIRGRKEGKEGSVTWVERGRPLAFSDKARDVVNVNRGRFRVSESKSLLFQTIQIRTQDKL